jgi:hypothetical protein
MERTMTIWIVAGLILIVAGVWAGIYKRQTDKSKEPHPHDVGTRFE